MAYLKARRSRVNPDMTGMTGVIGTAVTGGSGLSGMTSLGTVATGVWEATDVAVAHGGTGVSTFTDGGILLGSGASAITALGVLANSEFLVGDGTTDPVAETGATVLASINANPVGTVTISSGGRLTQNQVFSTSTVNTSNTGTGFFTWCRMQGDAQMAHIHMGWYGILKDNYDNLEVHFLGGDSNFGIWGYSSGLTYSQGSANWNNHCCVYSMA